MLLSGILHFDVLLNHELRASMTDEVNERRIRKTPVGWLAFRWRSRKVPHFDVFTARWLAYITH